ncbi:bifunctional DNA-formamidopyrimidine glycosylase/DNA-(apurinic or apyrimidinic site) lyase [Candidatus Parcubacteria bacterium]|nr:bifunctional DNA-formamidopyrimidine glycosylase/DNA-(apurinic or apyrimidinic site) lyase [Candidatus Parcubacteria bacterium]
MPELPEVQTTVSGLAASVPSLTIRDVWTDYGSTFHAGKDNIKNPAYFTKFKKEVVGKKIVSVTRRGKNVLINLSGAKTIVVHMKMTGHLLYGNYIYSKKENVWKPKSDGPLADPFNKWVHLVFSLSNNKHMALSDMRKFARVTVIDTNHIEEDSDLKDLGPEPLSNEFTREIFKERLLKRPNAPIKQALMDQTLMAGVGNIYSDELLWLANVRPESRVRKIPDDLFPVIYASMKKVLKKGIDFGGDSMSDYRNIEGERGTFQEAHNVYRKTGQICGKSGCGGKIVRKIIGGRSAHFCPKHQRQF